LIQPFLSANSLGDSSVQYGRILFVLAALLLTGAYLVVAQERREPWPPRPVMPPEAEEQSEPPRPAPVLPPAGPLDIGVPPLPPPAPTPSAPPSAPSFPAPSLPAPVAVPTPRKVDVPRPAPVPVADLDPLPPLPPFGAKVDNLPPPTPTPFADPLSAPRVEPKPVVAPPMPAPVAMPDPEPILPREVMRPIAPPSTPTVPVVDPIPPRVAPTAAPVNPEPVKPAPERIQPFRLVNPLRNPAPVPPPVIAPVVTPAPMPPMATVEPTVTLSSPIASTAGNLVIEKRGPGHVKHTDPIQYTILVRNRSAAPMQHIRIEDRVPQTTRLLTCAPECLLDEDRLIWFVATLAPGEERVFSVTVQASIPGDLSSTARVFHASGSSTAKTQVHPGAMPANSLPPPALPTQSAIPPAAAVPASALQSISVQVKAPSSATPGAIVPFEIVIRNIAAVPSGNMLVQVKLSEGLSHPEGREIDAEIKGMAAGGTESLKLPLKAVRPGPQTLDVFVQTADGQKATHRATVLVGETALKVRSLDAAKTLARQETGLAVEVANFQAHPVRNLLVIDTLPEGVDFVAADDRGVFRAENRSVQWLVETLGPGETKTLHLKVKTREPGEFKHEIVVRSDIREEAKTTGLVRVEGVTDLTMDVANRDKALEVGKETSYEILVRNQGTSPATGVTLSASISEGMAAYQATGPTTFRVEGRQLIFQPLRRLAPGENAKYVLVMTARFAGDQRLRIQLASDQSPTPTLREERMLVYKDN